MLIWGQFINDLVSKMSEGREKMTFFVRALVDISKLLNCSLCGSSLLSTTS